MTTRVQRQSAQQAPRQAVNQKTSKPQVWLRTGLVVIYGASIDADPHRHHAIQLAWPQVDTACQLNHTPIASPVIIAADVEHQLSLEAGWLLLVEPTSRLGQALAAQLAERETIALALPALDILPTNDDLLSVLTPMFERLGLAEHLSGLLGLSTLQQDNHSDRQIADSRIHALVAELDRCLQGQCLKPTHWRAEEVAAKLALSESRFLHLFRQEMGIAWRPYLLWRRMICAVNAILSGANATEAAHMAGFSDSAHLSRTFRATFGITFRQAKAIFQLG
uniref:helix-turn-helix transcriptional regulator n=1 Tax=Thaumasiovibrio occultus TaxID=1891184 RepID=UPI000B363431|nr:helix-turn-helix transcriptional regulator [Thaumasiovibrio occultus]